MIPFPLCAIVGQEQLIEALLVNAVAPEVGGLLVRGQRGTAKTTAVRGLAELLPPVRAAADQPFAFAPGELSPGGAIPADAAVAERPARLVDLPLGTTLDRLVGTLDLARALAGERAFEPGLLARAHQGILFVDEVNLLADHLVDALLDAAATGVARVEREAISVMHAARFLLVGTMNVEEGDLRPQLLDRFGLGVEVTTPADPPVRAEIVRRRLAYEQDPAAFAARFTQAQGALAQKIATARERLRAVRLPERELARITGACARLGLDGVRGDIVTARAARALAALDGLDEVEERHVRTAAALALFHRRRRDPLDGRPPDPGELERALDEAGEDDPPPPEGGRPGAGAGAGDQAPGGENAPAADEDGAAAGAVAEQPEPLGPAAGAVAEQPEPPGPAREQRDAPVAASLPAGVLTLGGRGLGPAGRRARAAGLSAGAIDTLPAAAGSDDLALLATLQARLLGAPADHLRRHVRAGRESTFLCLVVDASGSMAARRRAARVKGALMGLLRDAYARRDRIAVIAFRDAAAFLLVAPGAPPERAAAQLAELPTGGRTPLAAGLLAAERLIRSERSREAARRSLALVLSDGRITEPLPAVLRAAGALGAVADGVDVIDTDDGPVRFGVCAELARAAGGRHHLLSPRPAVSRYRGAAA